MATEASREENVYMAKLAEQAERYEEMVEFMEKVTKTVDVEELTVEERNLLSVAYKNVIGAKRASWRIISSIERKEESRGNDDHVKLIKDYRSTIETELSKICDGSLGLLESHLVPSASSAESKIFYLKMKGDYFRYLAEFKTGSDRKKDVESTLLAYKSAQDIALSDLAPTDPIRLGLALNFSVFYYEILNSTERACNLAKQMHEDWMKYYRGLKIDCDIRELTPIITNQKDENVCVPLVMADMTGTIHRVYGGRPDLHLSGQPLIDEGEYQTIDEVKKFVANKDKNLGFENVVTYPLVILKSIEWKEDEYVNRVYEHFSLDDLIEIPAGVELEAELCRNFCKQGKQFPIYGVVDMRTFRDCRVAYKAATVKDQQFGYQKPSKGSKALRKLSRINDMYHALLIVGLNTMDSKENKHFCWVKNTYGPEWGDGGFSRIVLTKFLWIYVPIHNPKEIPELKAENTTEVVRTNMTGKHQNLMDVTDPEILNCCVLVRHLATYTKDLHVLNYFSEFGEVKNFCFVRGVDNIFSKSCIVEMGSAEAKDLILKIQLHRVYRIKSTTEEYNGSLEHVKKKGTFKMTILQYRFKPKNDPDQDILESVELYLNDFHPSEIQLLKEKDKFSGMVEVTFFTEQERALALDRCVLDKLEVFTDANHQEDTSTPPAKKKPRKKAKMNAKSKR